MPARVEWGSADDVEIQGVAAIIDLSSDPRTVMVVESGESRVINSRLCICLRPAEQGSGEPCVVAPLRGAHRRARVDQCVITPQPTAVGALVSAAAPCPVRRIYYIYATPAGAMRGGHSHFAEHRLLLPLAGSFRTLLDDGHHRRAVTLTSPGEALYIPPGIWRELDRFAPGTICMAMSSTDYDAADYVRSRRRFEALSRIKLPAYTRITT